jgi:predicted nucleic acid-binding protein
VILVDTSIWIDHFREANALLQRLLISNDVLAHPWVRAELALGRLKDRENTLHLLASMPQAQVVSIDRVFAITERLSLSGRGIGLIDVQILVSTLDTFEGALWTRDRRLAAIAAELGVAYDADTQLT